MIDRKAIKIQEQMDRPVAAGVSILNEGQILCEQIENGVSKVFVKAVVDGSEKIAGVSLLPYSLPTKTNSNEPFTVPASGSLVFSLRNANVNAGASRAIVVGGVDLTIDETNFNLTPATGTVKLDLVGGRIKFAAGDAGKHVNFIYRYDLTVTQASIKFGERNINNRNLVAQLGQVSVAKGYIEIATDQFDPTKDYTAAGAVLTLGAGGIITLGGTGAVIPNAKVLAAPDLSGTVAGPFLRFSALIG